MSSRITENGERGKAVEYYLESKEKVLQELGTTEQGLTSEEAAVRLKEQGKNLLAEEEKRSTFRKFLDLFDIEA